MNAHLYCGTSGWSYASWKPKFYPPKLPARRFLEHYATRLPSVEVNASFRRLLPEKNLRDWIAATPQGFRFTVKANQWITHMRRLKDAEDPLKRFLETLQPLLEDGRMGAILFQLPPNLKVDIGRLEEFLSLLPRGIACAMEFRHDTWFGPLTYKALERHNVALCISEREEMQAPQVETADFSYLRLRRPDYTSRERSVIAGRVSRLLERGRTVYAYFKHEESPAGAVWAEELLQRLGRRAA